MSRQFEESMGGGDWSGRSGRAEMSVDVADHGEEYVVTADLPGFDKEDIDVSLREDVLTISAEHEEETSEENDEGRYLRQERRHQSASRSVTLPERVDESGVSAQHRNGVLTVTLPKLDAEEGDSTHIDIG